MQRTSPLERAFETNSTASSFTSLIPTVTEPAGVRVGETGAAGVFNLLPDGKGLVPDKALVSFFGAGNDNDTFDARLVGWDRIGSHPTSTLWVPRILASFSCTVSQMVGIAGSKVINTDRFVDTITLNAVAGDPVFPDIDGGGNAASGGTVQIFSPANNLMAYVSVPILGCEKLQFIFDSTGATNANALFRFLREAPR